MNFRVPHPLRRLDEGWGTLKVHFKNKGNDKAIANHRSVNYRSGIISLDASSIADSMDAKGRATRQLWDRYQKQLAEARRKQEEDKKKEEEEQKKKCEENPKSCEH